MNGSWKTQNAHGLSLRRLTRAAGLILLALLALTSRPHAQIATVIPWPQIQFSDANGSPVNGGKLCTYSAGTTTPLATYSDSGRVTPNANPVMLNAAGIPTTGGLYLGAATYKFILLTAGTDSTCNTGATIWTQDNVAALAPWNLNALTGTITFSPNTVLTVTSNAITPTLNVHGVDTAGGAQNLNTINVGSLSAPFLLTVYANNGGANPVTLKDGVGNLSLGGGDYTLSTAKTWITLILRGTTWYELARSTTVAIQLPNRTVDGRVSFSSGNCATDVTAATTVYYTPCYGNSIALFDGSATWTTYTFTELSIAIPATTNQVYDVFAYNNAGTPALELATWTSDTVRTTVLVAQNGVQVKSGATTRRYLGSFRTTGVSGQSEDSKTKRYLWNEYNRIRRPLVRQEATATWGYTLATWHQANAAPANQVEVLIGVAEATIDLLVTGTASNGAANVVYAVGIGEDSTSAPAADCLYAARKGDANNTSNIIPVTAKLTKQPAIGRHFYTWLEISTVAGTTNWIGVDAVTFTQSGITGWFEG